MSDTIPLFGAEHVPDLGAEPDRDTWCTKPRIAEPVHRFALAVHPNPHRDGAELLYPLGLDPCSNDRSIIRARIRWTRYDAPTADPIRPWRNPDGTPIDDGGYVNWPWSGPEPWVRACYEETQAGAIAWVIGCGIADPSTEWFDRYVWEADLVCWPKKREEFSAPPGATASSNTHPIAIPLWIAPEHHLRGIHPRLHPRRALDTFYEQFAPLGAITRKPRRNKR